MVDLAALQQALGVSFNDPSLLEQALVHSSYINENPGFTLTSNERLEFLGDSVLNLVVTEYLYLRFPSEKEGKLSQLKSLLVSKKLLCSKAKEIGLGKYLLLSEAELADCPYL